MKFLIDAQLPRLAVGWFASAGCDTLHTLDLPQGNHTPDLQIADIADQNDGVVVTKDADFVDSHLLHSRPAKLLLISTGNISNAELEALILPLVSTIVREFQTNSFLELGRAGLIVRRRLNGVHKCPERHAEA